MRINITTGTKEQFSQAVSRANCLAKDLEAHYTQVLQEACDSQTDILHLQGLPLLEKNSDNFQSMGNMERAIVTFLNTHKYPKEVEIIADCDEAATMYRVVYNFWFATEKATRMEDSSWD